MPAVPAAAPRRKLDTLLREELSPGANVKPPIDERMVVNKVPNSCLQNVFNRINK